MLYLYFDTFYFYLYSDPRHLIFEKNCHKPRNIKSLALVFTDKTIIPLALVGYELIIHETKLVLHILSAIDLNAHIQGA